MRLIIFSMVITFLTVNFRDKVPVTIRAARKWSTSVYNIITQNGRTSRMRENPCAKFTDRAVSRIPIYLDRKSFGHFLE